MYATRSRMSALVIAKSLRDFHRVYEAALQPITFGAGANHPIPDGCGPPDHRLARSQSAHPKEGVGGESIVSSNDVGVQLHA